MDHEELARHFELLSDWKREYRRRKEKHTPACMFRVREVVTLQDGDVDCRSISVPEPSPVMRTIFKSRHRAHAKIVPARLCTWEAMETTFDFQICTTLDIHGTESLQDQFALAAQLLDLPQVHGGETILSSQFPNLFYFENQVLWVMRWKTKWTSGIGELDLGFWPKGTRIVECCDTLQK